MGRLTSLRPRLCPPRSRLGGLSAERRAFDRERDQRPWRRWYKTARWQALRMAVLLRDLYTCGMCGRVEPNTSLLVADHRTPHRGDETLFWDEGNLWCLCKPCHDSAKQREERRAD